LIEDVLNEHESNKDDWKAEDLFKPIDCNFDNVLTPMPLFHSLKSLVNEVINKSSAAKVKAHLMDHVWQFHGKE
jgi:hypothetical protein